MSATTIAEEIRERVDRLDWEALGAQLDAAGFAVTPPLLERAECETLAGLFEDGHFRSTIEMARHRFGDGRYRYFDHPLPETITALRSSFYPHLAPVANRWSQRLRVERPDFPPQHEQLLERCRPAGLEPRACPDPAPGRLHHLPDRGTTQSWRHRVGMRHGVSTVTSGRRTALGVIFHDAK